MSLRQIAAQYLPFVKSAEPRFTREESLGLRPVRNSSVQWELRLTSGSNSNAIVQDDEDTVDEMPVDLTTVVTTPEEMPVGSALTLIVQRREDTYARLITKIFGVVGNKRIELDEFGSQIWLLCDGTHAVDKMVTHTSTRYKLNRRQAEVSVVTFMRMLGQRRLIGFQNPERRTIEHVSQHRTKTTSTGSKSRRRRH